MENEAICSPFLSIEEEKGSNDDDEFAFRGSFLSLLFFTFFFLADPLVFCRNGPTIGRYFEENGVATSIDTMQVTFNRILRNVS